ncbi:GNAT family acetyltransferase [Naasia lichenicola]|uniref:GNAT family acetyltransferase n=1 Tax=Naasia lichenicola TaxID=2565933 RepID=A0A4S4FI37_9MICO|nr:GNAT family acetyltransferase [Naasia lichenicola]THG29771.1 GNAT family acetyltransferase [Naasia lichenicola]
MTIRAFAERDTEAVVALWGLCGLVRPWNDPRKDIARKLTVQPELFLVDDGLADGVDGTAVVATVMAGFDGHRGWLYYVAVHPEWQGRGVARRIVAHAEDLLERLGCPKVNIQIRNGNESVQAVWTALGYSPDHATGLGKRLIPDG